MFGEVLHERCKEPLERSKVPLKLCESVVQALHRKQTKVPLELRKPVAQAPQTLEGAAQARFGAIENASKLLFKSTVR